MSGQGFEPIAGHSREVIEALRASSIVNCPMTTDQMSRGTRRAALLFCSAHAESRPMEATEPVEAREWATRVVRRIRYSGDVR